jgi:hypothetical protein
MSLFDSEPIDVAPVAVREDAARLTARVAGALPKEAPEEIWEGAA